VLSFNKSSQFGMQGHFYCTISNSIIQFLTILLWVTLETYETMLVVNVIVSMATLLLRYYCVRNSCANLGHLLDDVRTNLLPRMVTSQDMEQHLSNLFYDFIRRLYKVDVKLNTHHII